MLGGVLKSEKPQIQDSSCPGQDSNQAPEYKSEALLLGPACPSMWNMQSNLYFLEE